MLNDDLDLIALSDWNDTFRPLSGPGFERREPNPEYDVVPRTQTYPHTLATSPTYGMTAPRTYYRNDVCRSGPDYSLLLVVLLIAALGVLSNSKQEGGR